MEPLIKTVLVSVLGTAVILLIKKNSPELSFVLSAAMVLFVLFSLTELVQVLIDFYKSLSIIFGKQIGVASPLIKCMAISVVSKLGTDICKDGSQTALASVVELGGILCAAAFALPVLIDTVEMISSIV